VLTLAFEPECQALDRDAIGINHEEIGYRISLNSGARDPTLADLRYDQPDGWVEATQRHAALSMQGGHVRRFLPEDVRDELQRIGDWIAPYAIRIKGQE